MVVDISQYRQAIGLFNAAKLVKYKESYQVGITYLLNLFLFITFTLTLVVFFSYDIERNPGPPLNKLSKLGICHANIRGLSHSKLLTIQTGLCDFLML